jgi:hypothetical protein
MHRERPHPYDYLIYPDDGLWDIALGLALLVFAGGAAVDLAPLAIALVPVIAAAAIGAKYRLVRPLAPVAAVDPTTGSGSRLPLWLGLVIIVMLGLVFPILSMTSGAPRRLVEDLGLLPFALSLGIALAILAPLCPRWNLYAGMIVTLSALALLLKWEAWVELLLSGVVITAVGIVTLLRFLRDHPGKATSAEPNRAAPTLTE